MADMEMLKLVGLDEEDLDVISAHVQDAVFRVADLDFVQSAKTFALVGNRFVWETATGRFQRTFERRRALLTFKRVNAVRTAGIDRARGNDVLSLLSVRFEPGDALPAGDIFLDFAGGASILLSVECIEVQLADQGAAWETRYRPKHPLSD